MWLLVIDINIWFFVAACTFIVFDVLSGLWAAFACGDFLSTKMREGLGHKITLMMWCVLAAIVDIAASTIGLASLGSGVPVFESVCGYICIMELGSVIENLDKAYPDTRISKFFSHDEQEGE